METSTPPSSPRASSPKRAKTGAGDTHEIVVRSSSTAAMDDVSLLSHDLLFCFASLFDHLSSFLPSEFVFLMLFVACDEAPHQAWDPIYWVP